MQINLNGSGNIYIQIAENLKRMIEAGVYKNEEKLPSVRKLGMQLGVNPNTVERSYVLLESWGYCCNFPKRGVYVTYTRNSEYGLNEAKSALMHLKEMGVTRQDIEQSLDIVYAVDEGEEND